MDTTTPGRPLLWALRKIIQARDYCAEHGHYPDGTVGGDQGFDDWAADLATEALAVRAEITAQTIAVGDRVQYKAAFLRSISAFTGPLPFAKGTVTEINKLGSSLTIATIDWGDDEIPPRVNVANLKRIKDWEPN